MAENKYLKGENIAPRNVADARRLIGKRVRYLKKGDIDRSGRGYFFPKTGIVTAVHGRNIEFDGSEVSKGCGVFEWLADIVEVEELLD